MVFFVSPLNYFILVLCPLALNAAGDATDRTGDLWRWDGQFCSRRRWPGRWLTACPDRLQPAPVSQRHLDVVSPPTNDTSSVAYITL